MTTPWTAQIAMLAATPEWTNPLPQAGAGGSLMNSSWFLLAMLAAMALAPFLLTMITSFVKLVVVGSLIRTALGTQQVPPTIVITGLALILTIHVMWPVGQSIYTTYTRISAEEKAKERTAEKKEDAEQIKQILSQVAESAEPPMQAFLRRHAHPENVALFQTLREKLQKAQEEAVAQTAPAAAPPPPPKPPEDEHGWLPRKIRTAVIDDVTILIPAFVLSELTEAFQIGFLIFIPFLIIDLVVSNVLLAMGMMMLSPQIVSLPLKLLLFVLIDGWQLIIQGVVLGYT